MFHGHTQKRRHCRYCRRYVLAEAQGHSGWHVVLTMLTCGLWFFVVLLWPLPFRCQRCGGVV